VLRADDGEVPPVQGDQVGQLEPLGDCDDGCVDRAERQIDSCSLLAARHQSRGHDAAALGCPVPQHPHQPEGARVALCANMD